MKFLSDINVEDKIFNSLSSNEIIRAKKFLRLSDAKKFCICRYFLRLILSFYTSISAKKIIFDYTQNGKPFLNKFMKSKIRFNLSHSHNSVLIACAFNREVGIDLEFKRFFKNSHILAKYYLTPKAYKKWICITKQQQTDLFYKTWVTQEAYLKGIGIGLSKGFIPLNFDFINSSKPVLCNMRYESSKWSIQEISGFSEYAAAISFQRKSTEKNLKKICKLADENQVFEIFSDYFFKNFYESFQVGLKSLHI